MTFNGLTRGTLSPEVPFFFFPTGDLTPVSDLRQPRLAKKKWSFEFPLSR